MKGRFNFTPQIHGFPMAKPFQELPLATTTAASLTRGLSVVMGFLIAVLWAGGVWLSLHHATFPEKHPGYFIYGATQVTPNQRAQMERFLNQVPGLAFYRVHPPQESFFSWVDDQPLPTLDIGFLPEHTFDRQVFAEDFKALFPAYRLEDRLQTLGAVKVRQGRVVAGLGFVGVVLLISWALSALVLVKNLYGSVGRFCHILELLGAAPQRLIRRMGGYFSRQILCYGGGVALGMGGLITALVWQAFPAEGISFMLPYGMGLGALISLLVVLFYLALKTLMRLYLGYVGDAVVD
jgi:hypothetical protein